MSSTDEITKLTVLVNLAEIIESPDYYFSYKQFQRQITKIVFHIENLDSNGIEICYSSRNIFIYFSKNKSNFYFYFSEWFFGRIEVENSELNSYISISNSITTDYWGAISALYNMQIDIDVY